MAGNNNGLLDVAIALGATLAARKVVNATWRIGAKKSPPTDPADPEVQLREAMVFAVLSGAAVAVAKLLVTRKAASRERHTRALMAEAKHAG